MIARRSCIGTEWRISTPRRTVSLSAGWEKYTGQKSSEPTGDGIERQIAAEERLRIIEGDITLLDVEAVVNAANKNLQLGGGVAGAIRRRGGPAIQEECDRLAPIEVGEAAITGGGNLKARYIIHAVGPVNGEGDEEAKLARATLSSLRIAADRKVQSIAFPAISTGVYGFPLQDCSRIMLRVSLDFLKKSSYPREIVFCLYGAEAYKVFRKTLASTGI